MARVERQLSGHFGREGREETHKWIVASFGEDVRVAGPFGDRRGPSRGGNSGRGGTDGRRQTAGRGRIMDEGGGLPVCGD